jgi:hypothetical protein
MNILFKKDKKMKKVISSVVIAVAIMTQSQASELVDPILEKSVMTTIINKSYGDFAKRAILDTNIVGDTANVTIRVIDPMKPYPEQVEKFVPNVKIAAQTSMETWKYKKSNDTWQFAGIQK